MGDNDEAVTVVSPEFFDRLVADLDRPAEPNQALIEAAKQLRQIVTTELGYDPELGY